MLDIEREIFTIPGTGNVAIYLLVDKNYQLSQVGLHPSDQCLCDQSGITFVLYILFHYLMLRSS